MSKNIPTANIEMIITCVFAIMYIIGIFSTKNFFNFRPTFCINLFFELFSIELENFDNKIKINIAI